MKRSQERQHREVDTDKKLKRLEGFITLWRHNKFAILPEMLIKGKCSGYFQPFHNGKACAVSKGKAFIIIFTKDIPASLPVKRGNRFYGEESNSFEGITEFKGSFSAYGSGKKIKGFYENMIGCNQVCSLKDKIGIELTGCLCILVIFIGNSDPCSSINKDSHFEALRGRFLPYRYSS